MTGEGRPAQVRQIYGSGSGPRLRGQLPDGSPSLEAQAREAAASGAGGQVVAQLSEVRWVGEDRSQLA